MFFVTHRSSGAVSVSIFRRNASLGAAVGTLYLRTACPKERKCFSSDYLPCQLKKIFEILQKIKDCLTNNDRHQYDRLPVKYLLISEFKFGFPNLRVIYTCTRIDNLTFLICTVPYNQRSQAECIKIPSYKCSHREKQIL